MRGHARSDARLCHWECLDPATSIRTIGPEARAFHLDRWWLLLPTWLRQRHGPGWDPGFPTGLRHLYRPRKCEPFVFEVGAVTPGDRRDHRAVSFSDTENRRRACRADRHLF